MSTCFQLSRWRCTTDQTTICRVAASFTIFFTKSFYACKAGLVISVLRTEELIHCVRLFAFFRLNKTVTCKKYMYRDISLDIFLVNNIILFIFGKHIQRVRILETKKVIFFSSFSLSFTHRGNERDRKHIWEPFLKNYVITLCILFSKNIDLSSSVGTVQS